jgi:iron(III) transport system substrate-binding protein
MKRLVVTLAVLATAGCFGAPPKSFDPVRLYVAPGLPGQLAVDFAREMAIARPTLVDRIDQAEVAWLPDPIAALALGPLAAPNSAPEQPGVPDAFMDPKRRFAPVGAIARVIVIGKGAGAPSPDNLYQLAEPRFRGRVALSRLDRGDMPMVIAALDLAYGERGTRGFLGQLAASAPVLVENDAEVVARVASGRVSFGLADSLTAAPAAQRHDLRLVFTDQRGSGCIVVPTALVVLPGAGPAARKLSAWLAGPSAERILAQRAVGLLPLRADGVAPPGLEVVARLNVLSIDWSQLAQRTAVWGERLRAWPREPRAGP